MNKQESNPNFHQWIAFYGKDDVGYIRILDQDINIMVEKKFQSRGIGTIMLNLVEKKVLITSVAGQDYDKSYFFKHFNGD